MAGIKLELDEYLARSDSKPLLKTNFSAPKLGSWFRSTTINEDENNDWWFTGRKSECCPSMTKFQRITGFCICVIMSGVCFTFSAMYIPVLIFKARKFALLYTLGSLFFIGSFSFLWGPLEHLKHLLSRERILFTISYLGSLFSTLYFALGPKSTPLTLLFAVAQVISLLWFLMNYVPGGQTGLKLFTKLFSRTVTSSVSNTLPI